jgi:Ca2+-binding EF-hand superfamily protein
MGSGASASGEGTLLSELEAQNSKPIDGSDMTDLESAQVELGKLRLLLRGIDSKHLKKIYLVEEGGSTEDLSGTDALAVALDGTAGTSALNETEDSSALNGTLSDTASEVLSNEYGSVLLSMIQDKMDQRFKSLRETFLSIDADRSGYISKEEFLRSCSNWGVMLDDLDFESVNALYPHQESEKALDRGINYNEFIALMTGQVHYKPGEGEPSTLKFADDLLREKVMDGHTTMRKAFKDADTDGSGSLEKNEMKAVLRSYHIECDEKAFDQFFLDYDRNGDGKFSYAEFVKLMQGGSE